MSFDHLDLEKSNAMLRRQSPLAIIEWALSVAKRPMMTTSFGYNSAVPLHLLSRVDKSVPVVWIDSGYNVKDAYLVAEQLMQTLDLNMHIYNPLMSAERRNALMGGIPSIGDENFEEFTRQVKLEPFERVLADLQPDIWLTGIGRDETEHRRELDILSMDARGVLKVAPIFYWDDKDIDAYMAEYQLPGCKHYFDPVKVHEHRECGLHTNVA